MAATIHANARTTPKIRAEIQAAPPSVSNAALARRFGVTKATVAKWRRRDQVHDGSHRPHRLNTTLTEAQEAVVVAVRELLLLPLDDLLVVAWEFLDPNLSRSALDRCLRRHGVNNLKAMLREQEGEAASDKPYKSFKDYEPGFVHVDIKYLPQMAGESARSYLFVAIDRATRWVYLEIRKDKSARSARAFLNKLIQAAPFKIQKILTDNDKAFTDRFSAAGERKPTGTHPFDVLCQAHGIEHRLIKPGRPQTNGMVERFNGRIAEILQTTRFDSSKDLKQTLLNYREVYNHHIPQRALGHVTPIQALKQWQQKRPEIFVKKVYNHAGLDTYASILPCHEQAKRRIIPEPRQGAQEVLMPLVWDQVGHDEQCLRLRRQAEGFPQALTGTRRDPKTDDIDPIVYDMDLLTFATFPRQGIPLYHLGICNDPRLSQVEIMSA